MICSNSISCTLVVVDNLSIDLCRRCASCNDASPTDSANVQLQCCTRGEVSITIAVDQSKYVTNWALRYTRNVGVRGLLSRVARCRLSSGL